jgi:hypothetical protein
MSRVHGWCARVVQDAATAHRERRDDALSVSADDAAAVGELLASLSEGNEAATALLRRLAGLRREAGDALEEAANRFGAAATFLGAVGAAQRQRLGADGSQATVAAALAMVEAAQTRQRAALLAERQEVDAAQAAVVDLVEEQQRASKVMVDAVVADVRRILEAHTASAGNKLGEAAAVASSRHLAFAAANGSLQADVAQNFQALAQQCVGLGQALEGWAKGDNEATQAMDDTVAALGVAHDKVCLCSRLFVHFI